MKKRYALGTVAAAGLVFVLACITVNIYFPEATVKQAAAEIVDEIRKTDAEKKAPEASAQLPVLRDAGPFSLVPAAYAQEATNVSTPAIRALKDSMKARFVTLKPYFDGGNIGETNKGMLDVRDETGLNLQDRKENVLHPQVIMLALLGLFDRRGQNLMGFFRKVVFIIAQIDHLDFPAFAGRFSACPQGRHVLQAFSRLSGQPHFSRGLSAARS